MPDQALVTFESVDLETLTAEESARVEALVPTIDVTDVDFVRSYAAAAQTSIARSARQALGNTRVYQTDKETQALVAKFKGHLTAFQSLEKPARFLAKFRSEIDWWQTKYKKVTDFIDAADADFQRQITELTVDFNINTRALEENYRFRRDLLVYIRAGKLALQKAREETLPALQRRADETMAMSDYETANDFSVRCDEFELKLSRLVSSLAITYIRKPQIEMLQGSQNTSINTLTDLRAHAITLWLQEMQMALSLKNAERAVSTAEAAREMTEGLFLRGIERTGKVAKATAEAAGKGIIRPEVIVQGTQKLIDSLEAVAGAWTQAVENSRAYEHDLAENTRRISAYQKEAAAA